MTSGVEERAALASGGRCGSGDGILGPQPYYGGSPSRSPMPSSTGRPRRGLLRRAPRRTQFRRACMAHISATVSRCDVRYRTGGHACPGRRRQGTHSGCCLARQYSGRCPDEPTRSVMAASGRHGPGGRRRPDRDGRRPKQGLRKVYRPSRKARRGSRHTFPGTTQKVPARALTRTFVGTPPGTRTQNLRIKSPEPLVHHLPV